MKQIVGAVFDELHEILLRDQRHTIDLIKVKQKPEKLEPWAVYNPWVVKHLKQPMLQPPGDVVKYRGHWMLVGDRALVRRAALTKG